MKLLLAIFSCHSYKYTIADTRDWFTRPVYDRLAGVRESWLQDVTCDYKIFKGRGNGQPRPDEVFLSVPDDYYHSQEKMRAIIRYALEHGYTQLCKVDDDTWLYWDRLMKVGLVGDYSGGGGPRFRSDYCAGFVYWLSRKAMEILNKSPMLSWAEDVDSGRNLYKNGIRCAFDDRYYIAPFSKSNQLITDEELYQPNDYLAIHSLSPDQMVKYYQHTHGLITR